MDPITKKISERICQHMNDDHSDAVKAYATHYGGVQKVTSAKMVEINHSSMSLEVDGNSIIIKFDHSLTDSEDAHRTLVAMLRSIPKKF